MSSHVVNPLNLTPVTPPTLWTGKLPKIGYLTAGHVSFTEAGQWNVRTDEIVKIHALPNHPGYSAKAGTQKEIGIYTPNSDFDTLFKVDIEDDVEAFCRHCDVMVIPAGSDADEEILAYLEPYKHLFGNLIMEWVSGNGIAPKAHRILQPLITFETSRARNTCRIEVKEDGIKVRLNGRKERVVGASYPDADGEQLRLMALCHGVRYEYYGNVLNVLHVNNHGSLHPSAVRDARHLINKQVPAFLYRDVMGDPLTSNRILEVDGWRRGLYAKLGVVIVEDLNDTLNGDYGTKFPNFRETAIGNEPLNRKPQLPPSTKNRMVTQDCKIVNVLEWSIAKAIDYDTTVIERIIRDCSLMNGEDYFKTGRTLAFYGLSEKATVEEIREYFGAPKLGQKFSVIRVLPPSLPGRRC